MAFVVVFATTLRLPVAAFAQTNTVGEPKSAIEKEQAAGVSQLRARRLTANTPELAIQAAAVSPDGKFMAYSDPLGIHVREMAGGKTRLLAGTQGHLLVRWTPDSDSLQTREQDAGAVKTMIVSLTGSAPKPSSSADQFVASPDRMHRAVVSEDNQRLTVQGANGGNARDVWKASAGGELDQFQWSPNSEQIAVLSSNQSGSALELIEAASGQKQVLPLGDKKPSISSVVWPQQNRIILIIDERLGVNQYDSNLWEATVDGKGALVSGGLHRLTSWTDFPIRGGSLTTDGKRLVFIRSFRQRDVYVAPLEAGGTRMGTPRRLTLDLGDDYPTGWTNDSKTVVFTSSRYVTQGIFRQDLDKQTAEQIVVMPGNQLLARGTPDGNSLLFRNYDPAKDPPGQLMRVPVGGGKAELVPNAERVGFNYRCSPNGPCVIAQKQDDGQFLISELDLAKGKGREIYRDSHADHLLLSPDGKWIADTSGSGAQTKIVLRSFSTGAVAREVAVRGVTKLISFDSTSDGKGFFVGDSSLTETRELYVNDAGDSSVLWREPGGDLGIWGVSSPDGKYLALLLTPDDSNVYMVENF
jgi:Tol biopolymer transport system component